MLDELIAVKLRFLNGTRFHALVRGESIILTVARKNAGQSG